MDVPKRDTDKVKKLVKPLISWYLKNARPLPWRQKPWCDDPYCVYVSEIMISETQMAYGSRVRRHGKSRAFWENQARRFLTMAEILR